MTHLSPCLKLNTAFFILVLFFAVIGKRREEKLTRKIINLNLTGSSKMQSTFVFAGKNIENIFRKLSILSKI